MDTQSTQNALKPLALPASYLPALEPATTTSSKPARTDRAAAIEALFTSNYGNLAASVYSYEASLRPGDDEAILKIVAECLPSYTGALTEFAFTDWASEIIEREARALVAMNTALFPGIIQGNEAAIRWAIRSASRSFAEDRTIEQDDLYQDVLLLIWQRARGLSRPGTAKLQNRLKALAKKHVLGYYTLKVKNRLKIVRRYKTTLGIFGASVDTNAELLSRRTDDAEPDYAPDEPSYFLAA